MRQIIINVVSNAVKYTKEGFILIGVKKGFNSFRSRRSTGEDKCDILEIKVTDTGVGIEKEKLKDIFKAYTKVL